MRYFVIILLVLVADQASKLWVMASLPMYSSTEVIPHFFHLTHLTNKGAAFSFLAGVDGAWRHYFFLGIGCLAVIVLTMVWFKTRKEAPFQGVGLALVSGGACGNLVDRFLRGEVTDFLDLFIGTYHWPAFNIADSAISVGVAIVVVCSLLTKKNKPLAEV